jgi:FtsH-binding integral membrane protein
MERTVTTTYDEGLRNFMINMYNHTAAGLAVSGVVAYLVYSTGMISTLMSGALGWLFILAPLGMILLYSFAGQNWSLSTMTNFYYAFVAVMGVSLSTIFAMYTAASIAQVFFITAATFAAASLYGYTTKKDLTSMGSFLLIGLIGIIIAMIVNIFLASSALMFAISILGVIIFTGLTAYDTQTAKSIYLSSAANDSDEAAKYGIVFAISLYLNFINLFQMLLSLLGQRE